MARSTIIASKPCAVCIKRKVKCDRLVPCTNCVKRGGAAECERADTIKRPRLGNPSPGSDWLLLWQEYEYWVLKVGIFKDMPSNKRAAVDLNADLKAVKFWSNYLQAETSFKLLDYSMEKLGGLYFGCLSDIGELYLKLEEYWARRENKDEPSSIDEYLWDTLIWAVLTMAVYYMPLSELSSIMDDQPVVDWYGQKIPGWSEELQHGLYYGFLRTALTHLKMADFMSCSDVRIIQIYLILSSTSFIQLERSLADSVLVQCIHVAKALQVDQFRPMVSDSAALRLTKLTAQKIWYRLCFCDYLQSGPNKLLCIHTENDSLITHAAYYEEMPGVDIYQSEDTYETLLWKLISLDRDLEQYSLKKPSLKSLDAIRRQLDIFTVKLDSIDDIHSFNSKFESFQSRLILNLTYWKSCKLFLSYYSSQTSNDQLNTYTEIIIALVLKNIKSNLSSFNRNPYVLYALSLLLGYHSMKNVFDYSEQNEQLVVDLRELLKTYLVAFQPTCIKILLVAKRVTKLAYLWKNIRIIDTDDPVQHPVFKILKADIKAVQKKMNKLPTLLNFDTSAIALEDEGETKESTEFRAIIKEFETQNSFQKILYGN
ncbi:AFL200Wp [Eremothecium gossypii ATCC 10895]|uniref:AFL200Wp n=1 Tax=Eremothecium gossypii (strain ATCC 10895 / CBS 109.51 / FGSC 9923 / NRRL Y-1056) TaxID=284811 RepID=Q755L4_EREGS|nr:AFL200Wp [Eremothecium gossypii ATCC 10895]AAS53174.1 AFL200Wp [Eremothecium gossypii ATCC 10895]AEY97484.1 FAFL200Wp [Eremothecium gossypii FDAG1]